MLCKPSLTTLSTCIDHRAYGGNHFRCWGGWFRQNRFGQHRDQRCCRDRLRGSSRGLTRQRIILTRWTLASLDATDASALVSVLIRELHFYASKRLWLWHRRQLFAFPLMGCLTARTWICGVLAISLTFWGRHWRCGDGRRWGLTLTRSRLAHDAIGLLFGLASAFTTC